MLLLLGGSAGVGLRPARAAQVAANPAKPNILLILTDDKCDTAPC
ncbi:MAG: hypothetical protein RIC55_21700 [Pirellulaceae bacterium]